MSNIILISDTSCDLPDSLVTRFNITRVPFYVSFDETTYYKEIKELSLPDFYKKMREDKVFPKTSLPSINDYVETFMPHVKEGKSIICVCLSSYFSGSYNSAVNARELILENYKDAKIEIINSLNATGGQGLLVTEIGRMIEDNLEFEQIIDITHALIEEARIFFYVDTLDYLEHGGRIGKASALLGTMLNVKPIIYLEKGQLYPIGKVRGKKKAVLKVSQLVKEYVGDFENNYQYMSGHADSPNDALTLLESLQDTINADTYTDFFFIGTTIGVNTGPDTCGICVIPKYETKL